MMKNSKHIGVILLYFLICFSMFQSGTVYASDGAEYITITVDAEDDNDNLMYSLDSTEPGSFTSSNTFTIPAGTSHTIYVKDKAGNITSQEYSPSLTSDASTAYDVNYETDTDTDSEAETQDISIDVEIGNKDYSSILDKNSEPAEPGMGTAYDKTKTDGSDDGEKVFYTVTTAEGDTFYMIIDQTQNNDNVYLLNAVTRSDLEALAVADSPEQKTAEEDNLLTALQNEKNDTSTVETDTKSSKSSGISPQIIMIILVLVGGGLYYYLKVYKNKKEQQMDVMDAMNMEDFEPEPEDEDEVADFEMADEEKQAFLDNLINGDDENEGELFNADPDEYVNAESDMESYATSHKDDEEDAAEEISEEIMQDIASQVADFESDYDPELDGEEN